MRQYFLGFSLFPGIGAKRFTKLITAFGSAKQAWDAEKNDLIPVLGEALSGKFITFRKTFSFEKNVENLERKKISFLIPQDKEYPAMLKQLPSYPFLLFVKGNSTVLHSTPILGIVGTRKITQYGRQVTQQLTQDIVAAGIVTVSGLAMGVDSVVHETTMDAGGKTIAVLGCGVDCCTPVINQSIYDRILATGGAVVSTFPPGMGATKGSFPARNAIIAGMSQAVLVTEGTADSGALITAEYAKKFSRPVFTVPGPITSAFSKGANALLSKGAIPVGEVKDILGPLSVSVRIEKDRQINVNLSKEEKKILHMIQLCPLHFDEIVRTIGKSPREIGSILSMMELKGLVENTQGMYSKKI